MQHLPVTRGANYGFEVAGQWTKKTAKSGAFSTISSQPLALSQNRGHHQVQHIKYAYLPITQHSNCGFEVPGQWIKISAKIAQIERVFIVAPQPVEIQRNGGNGRIWRIK